MRTRALGAVLVAWAVAVTGASVYRTSTPAGGGGALLARLWIDTTGGTCTRSSSPVAYSDAAACSNFNTALSAATAGDTVRIRDGTYPGLLMTGSPTKAVTFEGTSASAAKFGQLITTASNLTFSKVTFENRAVSWDGSTCPYWDYTLYLCGNGITLTDVVVDGLEKGKPEGDSNRLGGIQVTGNNHTFTRVEVWNIRDNKGFQGGGDNLVVQDSLFHDVALTTEGAAADVHLECAAVTEGNNQIWRRNKFWRCGQINWVSQNYVGGPAFGPVTLENNWFAHPILNETSFAWQAGAPCISLTQGNNNSNSWAGWVVRYNTFECGGTVVQTTTTADDNASATWLGNLGFDPGCSSLEWTVSYNVGSVCASIGTNHVVANALNTSSAQNQAPFYVDAPANNFHLNSTSAALNRGNTAGGTYPALDIDSEARYLGSAPDAGGDESQ